MLSPHLLKSAGLSRRATISPDRRRQQLAKKSGNGNGNGGTNNNTNGNCRVNRSGSLVVYPGRLLTVTTGHQVDDGQRENSPTLTPPIDRMRTPSPSFLATSAPSGALRSREQRNSATGLVSMANNGEKQPAEKGKSAPPQPLLRRKTTTGISFMRKLRNATKSGSPADVCKIDVHPYTNDPTIAWEMMKEKMVVKVVKPMALDTPMKDDCVRFVCLSDTRDPATLGKLQIPDGDVLLIAGNFTQSGHPSEVKAFNKSVGDLPHKYKVVIAGNHELTFDNNWQPNNSVFGGLEKLLKGPIDDRATFIRGVLQTALAQEKVDDARHLLTNCIYLEDNSVTLYGLTIYGSPWIPAYDNLAFNQPRGQKLLDKWNLIPSGVEVLLTHTPALGYGDLRHDGSRVGCAELLSTVRKRVHPKYHVFGHVTESSGCSTDGYTKFINACSTDIRRRPVNAPVIFDIPMPPNQPKDVRR